MVEKDNPEKKARGEQREFPILPLNYALEVAGSIDQKLGGKVSSHETLSTAVNVRGGALIQRIAAARRYGLIEGKGEMKPSSLAMKILHPISEGEAAQGMREAIYNVALFKELIERFKDKIPESEILQNILKREYNVPQQILPRVANAFRKNVEILSNIGGGVPINIDIEPIVDVPNTQLPSGKISPQLMISFRGDSHKFNISTEEDWELVAAIVKSLKAKWKDSEEEVGG